MQEKADKKGLSEYLEGISKPKRISEKFKQHPYIEGR
jgi:hypothetical protein